MSFATPVVIGRKVKLAFAKVTHDQFEARRMEYHRQLQEAFFTQFRIKGTTTHVIKSGESIWVLAQQRYNIPIWLLRQYNPDLDLGDICPGTKLVIPIVEATAPAEPAPEHVKLRLARARTHRCLQRLRDCAAVRRSAARLPTRLPASLAILRITAGSPLTVILRQVDEHDAQRRTKRCRGAAGQAPLAGGLPDCGDGQRLATLRRGGGLCRATLPPGRGDRAPGCGSAPRSQLRQWISDRVRGDRIRFLNR